MMTAIKVPHALGMDWHDPSESLVLLLAPGIIKRSNQAAGGSLSSAILKAPRQPLITWGALQQGADTTTDAGIGPEAWFGTAGHDCQDVSGGLR